MSWLVVHFAFCAATAQADVAGSFFSRNSPTPHPTHYTHHIGEKAGPCVWTTASISFATGLDVVGLLSNVDRASACRLSFPACLPLFLATSSAAGQGPHATVALSRPYASLALSVVGHQAIQSPCVSSFSPCIHRQPRTRPTTGTPRSILTKVSYQHRYP